MMAELGVVPGAMAATLFLALFLGPVLRRDEGSALWIRGARIGLAAFAIQNLADFTAYFPSILWTAALLRGVTTSEGSVAEERLLPGWRWTRGILLVTTVAAATVAGLAGLSWEARYRARQDAASGVAPDASGQAELAARLAPWNVDARTMAAHAGLAWGGSDLDPDIAPRSALAHANRAVDLSPVRPSARAVRARARRALGDSPGAWADLAEAARLYPLETSYARARDEMAPRIPRRPGSNRGAP